MKSKYIALAVLAAMFCGPFSAMAEGKNGIAATVEGEKLTVDDVRQIYENAAPQIKDKVSFDQFYPQAVSGWVGEQILYNAGSKSNVKSSKEYKETLKNFEKALISRLYVQQQVADKISDADVRKKYEELKAEFKPETEVSARHILVDDEKTANDLIARLKKGEDFNSLGKYSKDKTVNLGYFPKRAMVPEFGDVVFKMKKGEYTKKPIKTKFGYHVVTVDDVRTAKMPEYKEISPVIKDQMIAVGVEKMLRDLSQKQKVDVYQLDGEKVEMSK